MTKTLVIAGGGHASLPLIKMGRKWRRYDLEIILISEHPYLIYSGALPQYMAGFYEWDQTAVNLEELCRRYGVTFLTERLTSVDKDQQLVFTSDGTRIQYDYLLLNLGASSKPILEGEDVSPVKPMSKLLELRKQIVNGSVRSLLITGGGAAGSELALNLSHPGARRRMEITILEKNDRLLADFPDTLSDKVTSKLKSRGVTIHTGANAESNPPESVDQVILAAGNQPGSISVNHTFETGAGGRILTDDTLQVANAPEVFAAGDMADVGGKNYQPIGVHAVKQGVVLRKNIKATIQGKPLSEFRPYPVNPLILSDGPDQAYYVIGKYVISGRLFAILKYVLDMRWLEKYSRQPERRRTDAELTKAGFYRSSRKR
ncbi:MAG: FAD-dependent oxidoreductase [Bacteroidetes bacterium]|jgi:selenide,water dikinase|nr:FAD-dependent oxidoreductase [Bacteroidota bacterium]